jgi:hypothetical protein
MPKLSEECKFIVNKDLHNNKTIQMNNPFAFPKLLNKENNKEDNKV